MSRWERQYQKRQALRKNNKHKDRTVNGSGKVIPLVFVALFLFGVHFAYSKFETRLSYSVKASPAFKKRIDHVLNFIEENYPTRYKLIRKHVHLIGDHTAVGGMSRGHMSGASYASTGREVMDARKGMITLMSHVSHCPPGLEADMYQVKNCAGVIYHEAMHHYHADNGLYQDNRDVEHFHVYKAHYEFLSEMKADQRSLEWVAQNLTDFKHKSGL